MEYEEKEETKHIELFYEGGGHGGPYPGFRAAVVAALTYARGSNRGFTRVYLKTSSTPEATCLATVYKSVHNVTGVTEYYLVFLGKTWKLEESGSLL